MCEAASTQKISGTMVEAGLVISHDNMLAHTALQVQKFLATNTMAEVPHPSYLSDNTLCNFLFFLRMKSQQRVLFPGISKIQE